MEVEDLAPMTTFFSVLGWKHATEGKKAVEFAPSWVALGVRFDFTLLSSGRLIVANKEGRLTRIKTSSKPRQLAHHGAMPEALKVDPSVTGTTTSLVFDHTLAMNTAKAVVQSQSNMAR